MLRYAPGHVRYHARRRCQHRSGVPLKRAYLQTHSASDLPQRLRVIVARCVPICLAFAIAFAVDQMTQQRYSPVLGSAAIVVSVLSLFPTWRPATLALGTYGAIWLGFNLVRAIADDTGLSVGDLHAVSSFEATLFGGIVPSAWLQERFHDPGRMQVHDVALAVVHASFFVTPFIMAGVLWFRRRGGFWHYTRATTIAFALGLVGFVFLPTAPPWMTDAEPVTRITLQALSLGDGRPVGSNGQGSALDFDPNHVAAMPSVHVAAAVLVFLAMRSMSRRLELPGAAYAVAMSLAVVYLGEHFLLDAVLGWVIAIAGWHLARGASLPPGVGRPAATRAA